MNFPVTVGMFLLLTLCALAADAAPPQLVVKAEKQSYKNALVRVPLTAEVAAWSGNSGLALDAGEGRQISCQIERGKSPSLLFVLPELKHGDSRTFTLVKADNSAHAVTLKKDEKGVEATVGGKLFTRYVTQSSANKPYFYPILNADGNHYTRRFPMEKVGGESDDHIHHKGLWFTHGDVNGSDFWLEGGKAGETVTTECNVTTEKGSVFGGFEAATNWLSHEGKLLATDKRTVRIIPLPDGNCLLDFTIAIKPHDAPVRFGDTKEGTFGLRVAETLAPKPDASTGIKESQAKMINTAGEMGAAAWGKKAPWVDYWGPIGGSTYGIAMFDLPGNLRHPTTWHAREYGLFAVNPFGLHDFKLGSKGAGDHVIDVGKTLTLRYVIYFHKGDTQSADVAGQYAAFAEPPAAAFK
jgi:hypothetical protein